MPYKAIIFDLDGTLLDTVEDITDAVNRVLSKNGFPTHTLDAYRCIVGYGTRMLMTRVLPEEKKNDHTISLCVRMLREDYDQNWNVKTKRYLGIDKMLEGITELGLRMAILSNKSHRITTLSVETFLPHWTFDIVQGQCDTIPLKPDPSGALKIAKQLDILPSDFLFVGDTAVDMKTAVAAGMFPAGVLWGFRPDELKRSGAKKLISAPTELLNLLDSPQEYRMCRR